MKINDILNFQKFYTAIKQQILPIKLVYRLSKLGRQIENEVKFYQEQAKVLINKYAELDEGGNPVLLDNGGIKLKPETQLECQKEFAELDNLDIEIQFEPFKIEEFDNFDITPDDFQGIIPFLAD